jgi:hypothetical protein
MNLQRYIKDRVAVDENGCWIWQRAISPYGYGKFGIGGKSFAAHRASYEAFVGEVGGRHVCHSCDVRACCNPSHLFLGTNEDNRRDSVSKRRHARGESHGMRKLSEKQVSEIRNLVGSMTGRAIAAKFGISPQQVTKIKRGQRWAGAIS